MKVKRGELVKALTAIKPGLARREIVEAATHFIFTGQDVMTYNDQICIIHPFDSDFKCSISANEFYKIMAGMSAEDVELTLEEDKLKIKSAKTKASLATSSGEKVLDMIKTLELGAIMKKLEPLPEDFVAGAELCSFSASKDMSHPSLTCLLIEDDYIMSSDDLRISQYKMKKAMNCSILIPATAITELIKFPVVDYCVTGGWAFFATKDDVLFCCRMVEGKFNDYSKYFENFEGLQIDLPKDIGAMIETAAILTEGEFDTDKLVEIEIEKNKIRCRGKSEVGEIENETDIISSHDKIIFSINPMFLLKILEHSSKMIYKDNRALFDAGNFQHLMALKPG